MGYSISWLAFRGLTAQAAYQRLALTETTRRAEYARAKFTAHGLPDGWHLIVADRCDHTMVRPPSLASLSVGCEVVACSIEEHVMVCWSEHWRDGTRRWHIEPSSEKGPAHLQAEGELLQAVAAWMAGSRGPSRSPPTN